MAHFFKKKVSEVFATIVLLTFLSNLTYLTNTLSMTLLIKSDFKKKKKKQLYFITLVLWRKDDFMKPLLDNTDASSCRSSRKLFLANVQRCSSPASPTSSERCKNGCVLVLVVKKLISNDAWSCAKEVMALSNRHPSLIKKTSGEDFRLLKEESISFFVKK